MEPFFLNEEHSKLLQGKEYKKTFPKTHQKRDASLECFKITKDEDTPHQLKTGYFIGVDWIEDDETALFVAPKLNAEAREIDFTSMLFSSLRHPEVAKGIDELYIVKWDKPTIEIQQKQDLLTPFLVVEFLGLLKDVVRKGLKKYYYKVEKNLHSRIKGKVMVAKSIKQNLMQNKNLFTYCSYDEFGLNNKENRLLKKALVFVKRYLPTYLHHYKDEKGRSIKNNLQDTFNYINPAFQPVSEEIELNEIKHSKTNAFYQEYQQALRLAKLILRRFGYNISNTVQDKVQTPPFWIDMSKLFELYVLGLLRDRFHNQVSYHNKYSGNELDYLLKSPEYQMVIDAKYKSKYSNNGKDNEDIRQVSGYARLKNVYHELEVEHGEVIDCLIIHPDQGNGLDDLQAVDLKGRVIDEYFDVYKVGVKLPVIN